MLRYIEIKSQIYEFFHGINRLKAEIEILRKENIRFVDDSLQFIDEIISIFAGKPPADSVYNQKCRFDKSDNNMLLCKEI